MAEETTDFDQAMGQVESALGELERRQNEAPVRKGPFAKRIYGIPLAILALIMSAAVVAAVVIVTQTFPAVPATGLNANCAILSASPASVVSGSSGHLIFNCGASPAFQALTGTSAIPSFTLPIGYTGAYIIPSGSSNAATCGGISGNIQLTSGISQPFASTATWNYCAEYASAPTTGLPTFTVSWSI